ncbi:carbamoyltransferase [Candidatus Sumerlaeota bacterium]|nr:carbamoyltransferase [Candidatus Sumerlaeota bacterium]
MIILGISAYYHDSAAALLRDGELIAAASEERFTRIKHDQDFPVHAIRFCLDQAGVKIGDVDYVAFYDKPFVKFERLLATYVDFFPRGFASFFQAIPLWLKSRLWIKEHMLKELDYKGELLFGEHHMSHAASCFLVSPFEEAAILTVDGVGEWSTTTQGIGRGNDIELLNEIRFPHSLGLLYSAFTYYLGFKVNSAEYKVMGLAPYGEPVYCDKIRELIDIKDDGSYVMNMDYFEYPYGLRMTNGKFEELFGHPAYPNEQKPTRHQMDVAASLQQITNEIMLKLARSLRAKTGMKKLTMAGGVALNCVANGEILRDGAFEDLWVQPAAGDAGGALGVAFHVWNTVLGHPRTFKMNHAYWGPEFSGEAIKTCLDAHGAQYEELPREQLVERVAQLIDGRNVIGWFQGRMEFGPRALGNRSILGDARDPEMQKTMNLKIKFRESFRPFAPAVLHERTHEWFDFDNQRHSSPFMLLVCQVAEERIHSSNGHRPVKTADDVFAVQRASEAPAITHVDGSARLQTVRREENPLYYDLIEAFYRRTGCPVIINTSFNVRSEPIVCTPEEAYTCFMRTEMDYLVLGNFVCAKQQQPPWQEAEDWRKKFVLD